MFPFGLVLRVRSSGLRVYRITAIDLSCDYILEAHLAANTGSGQGINRQAITLDPTLVRYTEATRGQDGDIPTVAWIDRSDFYCQRSAVTQPREMLASLRVFAKPWISA